MKYPTGLVVGKFCPLHAGHELVIREALARCENVIILSYTSKDFPGCEPERRREWLTKTFPTAKVVVLDRLYCPEDDLPADMHRLFCANYLLNTMQTTVQAVFTSEDYGVGFANYLSAFFSKELKTVVTVDHVMVDEHRLTYPISGSILRGEYEKYGIPDRMFLSHFVLKDFIRRVAFLGGESSGKTTLARELANKTKDEWVPEYGRILYDLRKQNLVYEDMEHIGNTQIANEGSHSWGDYLYCDTTPLTTMFYSLQMFGRVSPKLRIMAEREYHKIYICDPSIEFEQDGTRRDDTFRIIGHRWYVDYLTANEIPFTIVSGTVEERVDFVLGDLGII